MPNIEQFNAPITGVEPSDKGIQAAEVSGRRLGMYGHQLEADANQLGANVEQHQADMELSHGYAASTTAEVNLTDGWNKFVADPANKGLVASGTAAKTYMDQVVEPTLDKFSESGFQTQKGKAFAIAETARLRQSLFTRTLGEQSSLTASVFAQNYDQTQSNLISSVLQDPSEANVEGQLALNADFHDALPSGVEGANRVHADELKTEGDKRVALAAYMGQMEVIKQQYKATGSSPAEAQMQEWIKGQKWFQYLGGEQDKLPGMLDTAVEEGQRLYKASVNTQDQATEDAGRGEMTALSTQLHEAMRAGKTPTPEQLQQVDALAGKYGAVKGLTGDINSLQTLADQGITDVGALKYQRTDPRALEDFSNRALLPSSDPRALTQTQLDTAFNGTGGPGSGTLSPGDHERLSRQITERDKPDSRTNVALKSVDQWATGIIRSQLVPAGGQLSPTASAPGVAAWNEVRREMQIQFEYRVNTLGQDPVAVANDLKNPNSPSGLMNSLPFWKKMAAAPGLQTYLQSPEGQLGVGPAVRAADGPAPAAPATPEPQGIVRTPPGGSGAVTIPIGPQVKAAQAAAAASPRESGESAAAYLKRTGD